MSSPSASPPTHRADNLPDAPYDSQPAGIYIHVPFCRAKCRYCDFYSVTRLALIDDYVEALLNDMKRCAPTMAMADSVYFGGGTPSLLSTLHVERIVDALAARFPITTDAEVTLELNPGTVHREDLTALRRAGVNRLNIGLQSTDDRRLALLGRIHTARQGCSVYRWARDAGFDNVGVDLIYATPGQTMAQWENEMGRVVRMAPDHLACYTLTVEPDTPMARQVHAGRIRLPDEQVIGDLFDATAAFLTSHGYRHYEISNFDRRVAGGPDRRSRHNRKYWTLAPYLGFGPSAHSYLNGVRWWNHRSLNAYLADVAAGRSPVAGRETLTRDQQIIEFVYLGLRQADGIDTVAFAARFKTSFARRFAAQLRPLVQEGWLEAGSHRFRTTRQGMRFLESVVGRLIA